MKTATKEELIQFVKEQNTQVRRLDVILKKQEQTIKAAGFFFNSFFKKISYKRFLGAELQEFSEKLMNKEGELNVKNRLLQELQERYASDVSQSQQLQERYTADVSQYQQKIAILEKGKKKNQN